MSNFNDTDALFDLLYSEKALTSMYNMAISESTGQLRSAFMEVWQNVHNLQISIFNFLHQQGDYKTPPADMQKLNETKQKFCHCCD